LSLKKTRIKHQNYVLGLAIVLSSIAISIRSSDKGVRLVLQDYPILIFLLIIISSILIVLYIQITKKKITLLSDQIKKLSQLEKTDEFLNELTERQREVYDLIISGRTNKEIMSELFIEQSTLKSHINQIYRKLDIKNRRELKSKMNR
jgi:DNA-binding NarL/FixJ family response regulator